MLGKIALALGVLLAGAVLFVALQPGEFAIERSRVVEAAPGSVYPHVVSPRAMNEWSPFARMDPQMAITYSGPESGVGARSTWDGPEAGRGRMTVAEVEPDREVTLALDFEAPMEAHNRARFLLDPVAGGTRVTWRMTGENGFVGKLLGIFVDMDAMVGGQFDEGLASLERLVEVEVGGPADQTGERP